MLKHRLQKHEIGASKASNQKKNGVRRGSMWSLPSLFLGLLLCFNDAVNGLCYDVFRLLRGDVGLSLTLARSSMYMFFWLQQSRWPLHD